MTGTPLTAEAIRAQVAEVLGEQASEIGLHEDLVEHGLDSIRLMSLVESWRERGMDVSLVDLAEVPTVSAWAALLAQPTGVA